MSIFQTPSPGKATRTGQSVTPMSSHQDKPNIPDPMPSIRHVPNAQQSGGGR
jgi:hypothetical protein